MNKAEFIAAISESSELSVDDTKTFLNAFINTVTETLGEGGTVVLPVFRRRRLELRVGGRADAGE